MELFDTLDFSYEEAVVLYSMLEQMEPHAFNDYENWIMIRTSDFISDCEAICLEKGLEKMTMKILEDWDQNESKIKTRDGEPREPKYSLGDRVEFVDTHYKKDEEKWLTHRVVGNIRIVDAYGTFFDDSEPYYDIYSDKDNILYKHVPESKITEKREVGIFHEPKYSCGDAVVFLVMVNVESCNKREVTGVIHVVDAYGEYFNETEPAYKIYSEDDNTTYRVLESDIIGSAYTCG